MTRLVELTILDNGNLAIELTMDGKRERYAIRQAYSSPLNWLEDWLEWHTCNGWTLVDASQIGALSEAPVLSADITLEDNGEYSVSGAWWYYADYQLLDPVEQLMKHGRVVFTRYWEQAA